ncbi:hypothetical protein M0R72_08825 [Candidatus Pacearchaeota archaeon]|jgi:hypothetical protein|nr:hypothetical protein [Candidatus Pacearchaeota archaeon]
MIVKQVLIECPTHGRKMIQRGETIVIQSTIGDDAHGRSLAFPEIYCSECRDRCYVLEVFLED